MVRLGFGEKVSESVICRQTLLEINQDLEIILVNPDETIKAHRFLSEVLPYHKDVTEKNDKWLNLLGNP